MRKACFAELREDQVWIQHQCCVIYDTVYTGDQQLQDLLNFKICCSLESLM